MQQKFVMGADENGARLCPQDQSQRVQQQERHRIFDASVNFDVLRLGFATAALQARGVAAADGSAPGRQPATAHVQTRIVRYKSLLHMQQKFVMRAGRLWG
jgi:hypothetical protein